MYLSNSIYVATLGLTAAISSILLPRADVCHAKTGIGVCESTSLCPGTNITGLCAGPNDIQCCVRTCSTSSGPGFCDKTTTACTGGTYSSGHCPGPSNVQCCVASCSTPSGSGTCQWNGSPCYGGTYIAGHCPGPADVQCCVGSTGQPPGTGLPGIDISDTPPADFWACAAKKFKVVVIQGYFQGCSKGGLVKTNFVSNYNAAKAAGIPRIDAYLFPCTGNQANGVPCKSPATQISEFLATVDSNNMVIGNYWFDLEPTPGGDCEAWNLGSTENEALAKQWVAELEKTGRNWGIYANGNQWTSMFALRSTDIGSQLPLWAVQSDYTPGVDTVTTFMGGWTTAVAKQYYLDTTDCGWTGGVDFDSFL